MTQTGKGRATIGNTKKNQKTKQNKPPQESHFYHEGDQAVAQVALRGCGVSILGDTQKAAECGPGQLAQGGPAHGPA